MSKLPSNSFYIQDLAEFSGVFYCMGFQNIQLFWEFQQHVKFKTPVSLMIPKVMDYSFFLHWSSTILSQEPQSKIWFFGVCLPGTVFTNHLKIAALLNILASTFILCWLVDSCRKQTLTFFFLKWKNVYGFLYFFFNNIYWALTFLKRKPKNELKYVNPVLVYTKYSSWGK